MANYNRDGVIAYAKKWALTHNPDYPFYNTPPNSDCANFVSQCMYEGGGMPMKDVANGKYDAWYYYGSGNRSSSWTGAQSLRLFIKSNTIGYPRMPYKFLSEDDIGQLEKGDLLFGLDEDATGSKNNRVAVHVAVFNRIDEKGKLRVYAHSEPRDDQEWETKKEHTIFCHFTGEILTGGSSTPTESWQARYGTALLRPSSTYNAYVKNLQEDLISQDYSCGSAGADGYFGSGTTAAVKAFQTAMKLDVDGLVGDKTKQALYAAVYG